MLQYIFIHFRCIDIIWTNLINTDSKYPNHTRKIETKNGKGEKAQEHNLTRCWIVDEQHDEQEKVVVHLPCSPFDCAAIEDRNSKWKGYQNYWKHFKTDNWKGIVVQIRRWECRNLWTPRFSRIFEIWLANHHSSSKDTFQQLHDAEIRHERCRELGLPIWRVGIRILIPS